MIKQHIHRKLLGAGWYRCVFMHKTDPDAVIKVAHRHMGGKHGRMEWTIWNNAPPEIKEWLVPCVSIHEKGAYLVMRRGKPVEKAPADFPYKDLVHDWKDARNWVEIDGKSLLADYATDKLYNLCKK